MKYAIAYTMIYLGVVGWDNMSIYQGLLALTIGVIVYKLGEA